MEFCCCSQVLSRHTLKVKEKGQLIISICQLKTFGRGAPYLNSQCGENYIMRFFLPVINCLEDGKSVCLAQIKDDFRDCSVQFIWSPGCLVVEKWPRRCCPECWSFHEQKQLESLGEERKCNPAQLLLHFGSARPQPLTANCQCF